MDLRQVVGHRTLIQAAASIICVDAEGRLLLGRRTDNHMWGYSGGAVEIDEKSRTALGGSSLKRWALQPENWSCFILTPDQRHIMCIPMGMKFPTLKLSIYAGITGERSGHSRKRLKKSGISLLKRSRWRKSRLQSVRYCRSTN